MVKRSFDREGAFFWKAPDLPHFEGSGIRFDREKPFDAFALVYDRRPMAIEAKWLNKTKAFGITMIRHCQEVGLDRWVENGGLGVILIGIGRGAKTKIVALNWKLVRDRLKSGRSIKKCELEKMPMIELKKGTFPLMRLLGALTSSPVS